MAGPRDASDKRLLAATRGGDAEAFGRFFTRHREDVVRYLRHQTGDAALAADLTAETFAAALLSVHRGRAGGVTNGAAWLMGIARHKLIDSYRDGAVQDEARRRLGMAHIEVDEGDLARIDELVGLASDLTMALEQLPESERRAVIERVVHDRDYPELAREAGRSEAVMRKRVSRGLGRLKRTAGLEES
jgi:RNA polymerase sigma-70 factor (ECF subfamily)